MAGYEAKGVICSGLSILQTLCGIQLPCKGQHAVTIFSQKKCDASSGCRHLGQRAVRRNFVKTHQHSFARNQVGREHRWLNFDTSRKFCYVDGMCKMGNFCIDSYTQSWHQISRNSVAMTFQPEQQGNMINSQTQRKCSFRLILSLNRALEGAGLQSPLYMAVFGLRLHLVLVLQGKLVLVLYRGSCSCSCSPMIVMRLLHEILLLFFVQKLP